MTPVIPEHSRLFSQREPDTSALAQHVCWSLIWKCLPSEPLLTGGGVRGMRNVGGKERLRSPFPCLFLTLSPNTFFWGCPPLSQQSPLWHPCCSLSDFPSPRALPSAPTRVHFPVLKFHRKCPLLNCQGLLGFLRTLLDPSGAFP